MDLRTGMTVAPTQVPSGDNFLASSLVRTLVQELAVDVLIGPIMLSAAATIGKPEDRHGDTIQPIAEAGGTYLVWCGLIA